MSEHALEQPLLRAANLSITFGGVTAVSDLSFDIAAGEIVGLVGPNGAGKTTCFNMLTGFYRPTAGRCQFSRPRHHKLQALRHCAPRRWCAAFRRPTS